MELFAKRSVIHPEDNNDVVYWTRKWGVSRRQIHDAILDSGSTDLRRIKKILKQKGELHLLPSRLFLLLLKPHQATKG
jgi:hypothetical protein